MKFPDFFRFPVGHPPSPYSKYPPLMEREDGEWAAAYLPDGLSLVAIGWIDDDDFVRGELPAAKVEVIRQICRSEPVSDGTLGTHLCFRCLRRRHKNTAAHGHYLFQLGDEVLMFPRFIIHYIVSHGYRPPDRLFEAVERGVRLTVKDMRTISMDEYFRLFRPVGSPADDPNTAPIPVATS